MGKFTGGRRRCDMEVLETAPIKSNSELEVDWLRWWRNDAWPDTLRYPPRVSTACRHCQADVGGINFETRDPQMFLGREDQRSALAFIEIQQSWFTQKPSNPGIRRPK